jgi:acetylornithine deacetylase/succinyl-diaminopimelate desuccinylase-like protein
MPKTSSCAFLFVSFFLVATLDAQTTRPDSEKRLARDVYQQFIEIPSGFTTGSTTPVAEAAAARLKSAGFPDSDIFLGGANPKKQNLVVRYHGTGKHKPILLLAHIDVVEAKREDWSIDPFQLTEKDGYFYGRGTGDDKAQAAIWIANLIQYKKENFVPDRDIIVALTADEEGGGPFNGVDWLIKNHRDLIDAEFCLNEGGWGEIIAGKHVANYLQVSEKYVMNFRLEVRNKGGHSSLPVPENAIYRLALALTKLSNFGFPLKTNEVTSAYFSPDVGNRFQPSQAGPSEGLARFAGLYAARCCRRSRIQCDPAYHLCCYSAGRWSRDECPSAARCRHRQLPRFAGRFASVCRRNPQESSR